MTEPMEVLTIGTDEFECVDTQLRTGVDAMKAMFGNGSIFGEGSGSIVEVDASESSLKVLDCVAEINPVQSGSGDPSPVNKRPISGWTGCKFGQVGKNLFSDGTITGTTYTEKAISLEPSTYTLSLVASGNSSTQMRVIFQFTDESYGNECLFDKDVRQSKTVTLSKPTKAILFYAANSYPASVGYDFIYTDVQLEVGTTATDYEPYTGKEDTIDFGQTVFGGSVNWSTGEMVIDNQKIFLDGVNIKVTGFATHSSGNKYGTITPIPKKSINTPFTANDDFLSSEYVGLGGVTVGHFYITGGGTIMVVVPYDQTVTSAAEINQLFIDHPVDFIVPLADPITVQLTPVQLEILKNNTQVWADTGDIDIKYYKNLKIIQDLLALKNDLAMG